MASRELRTLRNNFEWEEIGKFKMGDDLASHLRKIISKKEELDTPEKESLKFLLKSLHEDVIYEIKALPEYKDNKEDINWYFKTLESLYGENKTEISNYGQLFNIRQKPNQSLREFISEIRVSGYKIFEDVDPMKREALFIKCFIQGLINKLHSLVLEEIQPKTLEEAYNVLRNENNMSSNGSGDCYKIAADHDTNDLFKMLDKICGRLDVIESRLNNLQPRTTYNRTTDRNKRDFLRKCFNCNLPGHVAKQCRKPPVCKNCFKRGHIAENCQFRNKKLRYMQDDTDSVSSVKTDDILMSNDYVNTKELEEKEGNVYSLQKNINTWRKVTYKKKNSKPEKDVEINQWLGYINGENKKPKTVISSSNTEVARNKPVVKAEINGIEKSVMLDTGCESNVIDKVFLAKIADNKSLKIIEKEGYLKCANGSPIKVIGYTVVPVKFGNFITNMKFTIVDKIFPNVIIGLKYMKKVGINILPAEDAIKIRDLRIPFISKTESLYSVGNIKALEI